MKKEPDSTGGAPGSGWHKPESDISDELTDSEGFSRLDATLWQLSFRESMGARILLSALLLLMVLFALAFLSDFFGDDDPNTYANDGGDAAPAASEAVDADAPGPLSGTWNMVWRGDDGAEGTAFTLRFEGAYTGTVEVLNDENESETWFELEGDVLRFGFTRTFAKPTSWPADSPFPAGGWPENITFEGDRGGDGSFLGTWYRDDWECNPRLNPPCSYKDVRISFPARVERES
ncbi:MAG: hypothetical protein CVT68_07820 [Actinobacteria bacterium HGW-Actinobacteria-8]|nr:MAG: hypothetical protein CVT68_07820 [Actinobacteria bacterium HGW-Actinobacteria-8]